MNKKTWTLPTVSKFNVSETQYGVAPTGHHDATTYDDDGKWWASGVSANSSDANNYTE
ncbi:hypothetical protein [Cellulosilyticum ruminicola]|uniref:hypothetical protein n=1 Tax=Cellulosilyticum ruminicola TaxID=425254 RepID=UPI0012EEB457|nr:hypothetical protein [Cellulosilyticum ruminicola]